MNNEVLNDEFLKSIDSNYEFSNKPIRRLKKSQQSGEIKLQLENLKKQIAEIDACDLKNHANQLVFSDGNFRSKIMLVGEGPGQKEDEIGKPFMGDAGKLLNKMLAAIDIKRESIYITNVVNYRPPNNRKPTTAEINKYSKFLYEHISIINPNNKHKNIKKLYNPRRNRCEIQKLSVNECLNSLRLILLSNKG